MSFHHQPNPAHPGRTCPDHGYYQNVNGCPDCRPPSSWEKVITGALRATVDKQFVSDLIGSEAPAPLRVVTAEQVVGSLNDRRWNATLIAVMKLRRLQDAASEVDVPLLNHLLLPIVDCAVWEHLRATTDEEIADARTGMLETLDGSHWIQFDDMDLGCDAWSVIGEMRRALDGA